MTTCAEVERILRNYGGEAGRVSLLPAAVLQGDDAGERLAREIVGLANRDGGRVIVGVGMEGDYGLPADVEPARWTERVREICSERISPPVDCAAEWLGCVEGNLLVVGVPRREALPHAVVGTAEAGEPVERLFVVRHGTHTVGLSDGQLAWLYRWPDDPAIDDRCRVLVHLHAAAGDGDDILSGGLPQARDADAYAAVLDRLDRSQRSFLLSDRGALATAFFELTPYLLLRRISRFVRQTQGPDGDERWPALKPRRVSLCDVPVPETLSIFSRIAGGLRRLLQEAALGEFTLPAASDLQLDLLRNRGTARLMLSHPHFVLSGAASAPATGSGVHPALAEIQRQPLDRHDAEPLWVAFDLHLSCSFTFPDQHVAATEASQRFAAALVRDLGAGFRLGASPEVPSSAEPAPVSATDRSSITGSRLS